MRKSKGKDLSWLAQTYAVLSECYFAAGNKQKGLEALTEGLKFNPKAEICLTRRAEAYCERKQFDMARHDADALIAIEPKQYRAFLLRGRINLDAGKFKESIDDLSRAIKLDPEVSEVYGLRARVYESLGKKQLAESDRRHCETLARQQMEP
jgi:tetratricopeptide (TPR) repeat protein